MTQLTKQDALQAINTILSTLIAAFVCWLGVQVHQLSIQAATINSTLNANIGDARKIERDILELRTRVTQLEVEFATYKTYRRMDAINEK